MNNIALTPSQGRYFGQQLIAAIREMNTPPLSNEELSYVRDLTTEVSSFYESTFILACALSALFRAEVRGQEDTEEHMTVTLVQDNILKSLDTRLKSMKEFFIRLEKLRSVSDRSTTIVNETTQQAHALVIPWFCPGDSQPIISQVEQLLGHVRSRFASNRSSRTKPAETCPMQSLYERQQKLISIIMGYWQESLKRSMPSYIYPASRCP